MWLKSLLIPLLLAQPALSPPKAQLIHCATCYGETPCNACKNCRYCGHCAKGGGTCGVCRVTLPTVSVPRVYAPKPARKPAPVKRPSSYVTVKPLSSKAASPTVPAHIVAARSALLRHGYGLIATPEGNGVNVRTAPAVNAPRVTAQPLLPVGTRVRVLRLKGDWMEAEMDDGAKGWIRWRYEAALYVTPYPSSPKAPVSTESFP